MRNDDISPFYHLTGPYNCTMQGYEMAQNLVAPVAWMLAIQRYKPLNVIEIGTGAGGLSALLASVVAFYGGRFQTMDILDGDGQRKYGLHGNSTFYQWDCFEHVDDIAHWIQQPGQAFVLCDGGDKPREFNTFASYLKVGDVIGVHDYLECSPENEKRFWSHKEVSDAQIRDSMLDYQLIDFMYPWFKHSAWCVKQKV